MRFINEIIELFNNLSIENIIDIGIGLAIIVIFKIFSSFFAYILIKMFKFKNNKIKENGFYVPLKIFFVLLGVYICAITLKLPDNVLILLPKLVFLCLETYSKK